MEEFSNLTILLEQNGWIEATKEDPVYQQSHEDSRWFKQRILVDYYCDIYAVVTNETASDGISWLEVRHEYHGPSFTEGDLEEMLRAIEQAENLLLKLEIPFYEDYKFRNDDWKVKEEKNQKIREKYHSKNKDENHKKRLEDEEESPYPF